MKPEPIMERIARTVKPRLNGWSADVAGIRAWWADHPEVQPEKALTFAEQVRDLSATYDARYAAGRAALAGLDVRAAVLEVL